MAADESEYIRKTQDQLGALIKKPPLTEKLLSKPPFRFLHDVIMAIQKQTGFMDGLFLGDENDAQKVNNEKDAKIAFLQKAIDAVQMTNGQLLSVKPSKIVAGQEANRTNEFLQALAQAAKKGSNPDIVQRLLKGEKPESTIASGESGGSAGSNKENRERSESTKRKDESKDSSPKDASKERSSSKDRTNKDKENSKSKEKSTKDDGGKTKSGDSKEKEKSASKTTTDKEKEKEKSRSSSKTRADDPEQKKKKKDDDDEKKKSSSKSASATTKRPSIDQGDEGDRKRRSSKSAKTTDEKKNDAKSDDKSKRRQSSAAAKLDLEINGAGEKEKKRSSSTKREKEKEKPIETIGGGLRIDLSSGHNHNHGSDIGEIDHDESMNGIGVEEERPRFASNSANNNDDQEATSSLKTGGVIVRSAAARPSSAAGVRPGTAAGARPGTAARPAPPRMKRQELGASNLGDGNQIASTVSDPNSQIGQPQIRPPVVIQNDTKKLNQQIDDDDDFIVESRDTTSIDALLLNENETMGIDGDIDTESGDHGQLVRKILETKKELESQLKSTGGAASEKALVVFDAQEREKTKKETGKLQEIVQQLTRTSHPLAKIVDFLQEDVDSMLKELQQWKQESKKDQDLLRQETGLGTGAVVGMDVETLKNKLNDLDQQIIDQSESITAIRGVILNNEQRIQKMMATIAKK